MARRRDLPRPTDSELAILRVLWQRKNATVRDVHEALPDAAERRYTTTLKLMQIMAEKGLVARDESQRSHIYSACVGEHEAQDQLVGDLVRKAFAGSTADLVLRALSEKAVTQDELDAIQRLLDERQGGAS